MDENVSIFVFSIKTIKMEGFEIPDIADENTLKKKRWKNIHYSCKVYKYSSGLKIDDIGVENKLQSVKPLQIRSKSFSINSAQYKI